jgi:hypothetical protein
VRWRQANLTYFTDPGSLSASVNHAAADALVAAAASVWNVPVASITVSQGGGLAEHVSGANTYLGTEGMVWPADVESANSAAAPIAVVYDTDGSVTDLLLGGGASSPGSCRQNGVTESVDQFDPAGYILHAIIVVNGRCTGSSPQAQLQLQYQLERIFGRVLGLAWSQANDNVFTGTPVPTYDQALHWPILHPLDIVCGPYTYQCLPNPFQLRDDDIASLVLLYPVAQTANLAGGKQYSLLDAEGAYGQVTFSTGQGMAGVNVLTQRQGAQNHALEGWFEGSAVSGTAYRRNGTSPFVTVDGSAHGSQGTTDGSQSGIYFLAYMPMQPGTTEQSVLISTEPVNPLYIGGYSVEPYTAGVVAPSGSAPAPVTIFQGTAQGNVYGNFVAADSAATCGNGLDGTAASPVQTPGTGWWNGLICGYGHAAYTSLDVQPGRSLTVQVTALDEQGLATTTKMMPVMGVYASTDAPWDLPSVGVAAQAFNALGLGTTTLSVATGALNQLRIGIADQRGDGRPDFAYQARVFYADSVLPATVPASGGTVTIAGMGFRIGNRVTVNGVAARVQSWTSTQIVLQAPTMAAAGTTSGSAVDVVVSDVSTGAVSTMSAALTYDTAAKLPNSMRLVSAQEASALTGSATPVPFAVQVLGPDGVTPVSGEPVVFTASAGAALFSACGGASCTVMTDAAGVAATGVIPQAAGTVTLQAADGALTVRASFLAVAPDASMVIVSQPTGNQPIGVQVPTAFQVRVLAANGSSGVGGRLVTFSVSAGAGSLAPCSQAPCGVVTDSSGSAAVWVTPSTLGTITVTAVDGALSQSVSFQSVSNTDVMQVVTAPPPAVPLGQGSPLFGILLLRADGVTPDWQELVTFTASPGATLSPCSSAICQVSTGWDGTTGVRIGATQAGTYTVTARFGAVTQTVTAVFTTQASRMNLLSAPSPQQTVGQVADKPFTVQVLWPDGTPIAGMQMPMYGPLDQVTLGACGLGACLLTTDGNGIVSTTVTPLKAGPILLTADYGALNQTVSFTAVGAGDTLTVVTSPGPGTFTGDPENFLVQVTLPDGVTPGAGKPVVFAVASGAFSFSGCATAMCTVIAGANGQAGISGSALAPGMVTIVAKDGAASQAMSFVTTARADVMKLISGPSGTVSVGSLAAVPFTVQVFQPDGATAAVGRSVTFAVTQGSAQFTACSASPCSVMSDAQGMASSGVISLTAGVTSLVAADGPASQAVTFHAVNQPDGLQLVSAPGGSVFVGATAAAPFSVRGMLPDGVTPAAGLPVTFTSSGAGQVQFGCGAATCSVTTDAQGLASMSVSGGGAGAVTLTASLSSGGGGQSVSSGLQVLADQEGLNATNPRTFVAAGASFPAQLAVAAYFNGVAAAGLPVSWSAEGAMLLSGTTTTTDSSGGSSMQAAIGPLASGATASATACAWVSVCATFFATGVAIPELEIQVVSGGAQTVPLGTPANPVTARVSDGAGHPVAGAAVTVYQEALGVAAPCPRLGRCPAAPVLRSGTSSLNSDAHGLVSVSPLTVSGVRTETRVLLTVGTQGTAAADIVVQP